MKEKNLSAAAKSETIMEQSNDFGNIMVNDNVFSSLVTISHKARNEGVSVQCVHSRIKRGIYESVVIDGVTFVKE